MPSPPNPEPTTLGARAGRHPARQPGLAPAGRIAARTLAVAICLLAAPDGRAILHGQPAAADPRIAQATVAILIEDQQRPGPDGRPGFYPMTGVMIARDWVLTARHGFANHQGSRYRWRLRPGAGDDRTGRLVAIESAQAALHPTLDLALIRVDGWPAPFGFRPARIGRPGEAGERVILAGYGETGSAPGGGALAAVEETVSAPAVAASVRRPLLFPPEQAGHYMEIDQRDGRGSCRGDSGGPVFRRAGDDLELIGIIAGNASVGGGHPCLGYSYAARLDAAVAWIAAITGRPFNALTGRIGD